MSSRRDREKREERQNENHNQNQSGGWAGAPSTWEGNKATANPIGGGTKSPSSQTGTTTGRNDTYAGSFVEVRDNPGQTNYREPYTPSQSYTDNDQGRDYGVGHPTPTHTNTTGGAKDTHTGGGTDTPTGPGPVIKTPEGDSRAKNLAELARVTGRSVASHHVNWGSGSHFQRPTHPADQAPQGRRITSPNTGLLPTLSQNTVTPVQPKKAATEIKQDRPTCKARPKDNRPKGGGGGGTKKFVPWC